jgi:hypothetical protein
MLRTSAKPMNSIFNTQCLVHQNHLTQKILKFSYFIYTRIILATLVTMSLFKPFQSSDAMWSHIFHLSSIRMSFAH